MKKHLLTHLVLMLLAVHAWAQQSTAVTIGTGLTSGPDMGPVIINSITGTDQSSRHAAIYTAAEINATPTPGKALTKISWNKSDTSRYTKNDGQFKIYIKQTSTSSFSDPFGFGVAWTNEVTGATLVYNSATQNIAPGAGWRDFPLPTPFIWNGTSNLEVLVEWYRPSALTGTMGWFNTAATNKSMAASGPVAAAVTSLYVKPSRPDIRFTFTSFNDDAGISAITAPVSPILPNVSTPVKTTLKNFGGNAITTAIIGWKVNGIAQPDYTWNGNVASGLTDGPITIGNFTFPIGAHKVKAYVKTVNGSPDPIASNDTTSIQVVACSTLAGNYTINKGAAASATNFQSFTSAAQVMNSCGINGPVTFTVAPGSGTYNETLTLTNITGTSATNTITIEGNGNTITSGDVAVVKLDRANYVKINNLVITSTSAPAISTTLAYGIQLTGPSDYATISNCTINMAPTANTSNVIGILIGAGASSNSLGNYSSNSLFQNNTINGGYYSMRINGNTVTGSAPIGAANNRISGNQFRDFYTQGIYMSNADRTIIEGNYFSRPTSTNTTTFNGIQVTFGSINTIISKNRFHNTHGALSTQTSGMNVITVDVAAPAGSENIIRNNLFYDLNNTGNITVFSLYSSTTGLHIYNNTISIENPNRLAGNSSTIKVLNLGGTNDNTRFINNIVSINLQGTGNKYAINANVATTSFTSNNNVIYMAPGMTSALVGAVGTTNYATIADWQTANSTTPYDMNSVSFNPAYTSLATGNLKPTSLDINDKGQALTTVTDDILGVTRSATTPDPGAYEFDLGSLDAGVIALVSPNQPAQPGVSTPVTVTLKNFGTANLTAATIGWKVNGLIQPSFAWTGTVAANQTATVTLGNYTFAAGAYSVCAWTKSPNGGTDVNTNNDSTCTAINACAPLAGNYTINKALPASATNFPSFVAASTVLHNCGVSAKVTFTVAPASGPYTEQVDILSIPGVSAANRVVFEGNGNTLEATPDVMKTTVLKLDNADYLKINNLKVVLNGNGNVGNPTFVAIQMMNNSDNDTISNCTVITPTVAGFNAEVLGILAGTGMSTPGNNTNNSVFLNNTIKGGLYGIKINGNGGGTGAVNNRLIGNTVQDFNSYGIDLDNADGCIIEKNIVSRPTYTSIFAGGNVYAIRLTGSSKNNRISMNRIQNLFGGQAFQTGTSFGVYSSGQGAPVGSENIVSNNVFYDTNTPGIAYGIYNEDNSGIYYYHNTISITNGGIGYGFFQNQEALNIKFINNTVSINTAGSANKYALYFNNVNSVIESNNNNLYLAPNSTGIYTGHFGGTDYVTLTGWKAANGNAYDQLSVAALPDFKNPANGDFTPMSSVLNNVGKPLPAVTTDIMGNPRNTTTPDLGAYEFTPIQDDAGVIAIVNSANGCGLSSQETVTITIQNFATATQTSIPVSYQVDGGAIVTETFTGSLPLNTTANYTFTTKANLSAQGAHTIIATTILPGDAISANDAKTVTITNATQTALPIAIDFDSPATGINAMRTVINTQSNIVEGTGASLGTGTKGLIMDGVNNTSWASPLGVTDPWTNNPDNFSAAYICLSTAGVAASDSLYLTFDLKQLFKTTNANTNFRVTVNGTQVGATYRPAFSGSPINWLNVKLDLTSYKNNPAIQIGFESNVSEEYANGTGTANLIDNINIYKAQGPTGVKADVLASQVHVFPNPSNGIFNIDLPGGSTYQLEVTDLTGKVIHHQQAIGNAKLNLEGTTKGIYLLKVSSENGSAVRKLIVE